MIIMMCLIGYDDGNGSTPGGSVFFELIAWAVLSLAVAIALLLWIPTVDRWLCPPGRGIAESDSEESSE